jgi:hypothetical protein
MYENGKMRPVETVPGKGEGGNSTMTYCKNFCKYHTQKNVPQYINNKKKKRRNRRNRRVKGGRAPMFLP